MICNCEKNMSEHPILCDKCKFKRETLLILRDFTFQWAKACKYKKYDEYTFADLDAWINDYIDYTLFGKKEDE